MRSGRIVGVVFALGACAGAAFPGNESLLAGAPGGSFDAGGFGGTLPCTDTAQCPSGLQCADAGVCVSPADNKPPEQSSPVTGPVPAATPDYVFALDPAEGQAVRVDAQTLAIEAIPLGGAPAEVDAFAGSDRVLVLNPGNDKVHLLDATAPGPTQVTNIPLDRRQDHLRLSPDGTWAAAFTDPYTSPDQGAEGIVTLVRLGAPGSSPAGTAYDRAAGFRVSDLFFRAPGGATKGAVVVALDAVTFVDFTGTAPPDLPPRQPLPASASADLASRSVVATADGAFVLIRSFTAPDLTIVDVDAQTVSTLTLPDVATDLEIEPGGTAAVAVMRATAQVAVLRIPQDLQAGAQPTLISLGSFNAGQIAFSPVADPSTGPFGLLFTNASPSMGLVRLDVQSGKVTPYPPLQKLVQGVGLSPDGKSAVVVHRPDPDPQTTDPYAAQVAKDEGYSMFDIASEVAQLKRTGTVAVEGFAFAPKGGAAAVALSDAVNSVYGVDVLDLQTLVATSLALASPPEFVGAIPQASSSTADPELWVTQVFAGGRISFVDLSTLALQTVTGFELNSQIQN
ncbi:MAG: YncE family protein [Myxococcales bacterium]